MTTPPPIVTIILSTYNRPRALRLAMRAVIGQSEQAWRLLVIGDFCAEETGHVVAELADPRIHYINLPQRCGEQSGPNSVGLALADTPYVAFLNHDDIWFPDHLEVALGQLDKTGADFFAGRAAFALETKLEADRIVVTEVSPVRRRLGAVFYRPAYFMEPTSAWVLRRAAAERVGAWRASTEIYRSPLEDWLLRAWRAGLRLTGAGPVTVIKPRLMGSARQGQLEYDHHPQGMERLAERVSTDPDRQRREIEGDVARAQAAGLNRSFDRARSGSGEYAGLRARHLNPLTAAVFAVTGYDVLDWICERCGVERGYVLRWALKRRTGEILQPRPPLAGLIADARRQFSPRPAPDTHDA